MFEKCCCCGVIANDQSVRSEAAKLTGGVVGATRRIDDNRCVGTIKQPLQ